jgi:serine/threonine-protein kinase
MSDGRAQHCRLLKSLPHLGERVVERLESMPMAPARRDGVAISVDYVFNLAFKMPQN